MTIETELTILALVIIILGGCGIPLAMWMGIRIGEMRAQDEMDQAWRPGCGCPEDPCGGCVL